MAHCMTSILALSVTDKIEQYGAYAGFASVLGLAVLSLLYFAQAREVKRLREWAGRSPERALEQQDRAVAAAQQRVVAQPARPAGQPGAPQQPVQPGQTQRPAAATPAGQAAATPAGAAAAAATAAGAAGTATAPGAPGAPAAPTPGAPGAGQPTTAMPAANGAAAASPPARPGQPLRVPPGANVNGPAGTNAARLQDLDDDEPRSRTGFFAALGAILVVAVVGVVLITGVLGGGKDNGTQPTSTVDNGANANSTSSSGSTSSKKKKSAAPSSTPKPGAYTVAVLNGTTVPGLARGVANRLQENKYKIGNVTNAATQDRSATLVEFAQGHRAEADQVAKAIDVAGDSIQPLSAGSKTIAGDAATVVVTVGSDQNVSPQSNGTATGTTG
jgi:hypothetical protein